LKELKNAGIMSFKIEGRSKTINYIAGTWRAYRKALDILESWGDFDLKAWMDELFAISNRGYIPWFLVWDLWEKSIYYEKNYELKEEDFVWIVRWYDNDKKLALVEVKNRFDLWDTLKLINPTTQFEFKIEKIIAPSWDEKQSAHGWHYNVQINIPDDPGEFGLLRKKIMVVVKNS
jgi:putative protease